MKITVFDLETNSTDVDKVTKLHCISTVTDGATPELRDTTGIKKSLETLDEADVIVGHNIVQYDLPVLKRMIDWEPKDHHLIRDTMIMGYIGWPEQQQSLEDWGFYVGSQGSKIQISDFERYTPELGKRCAEDTKLNWDVWEYMRSLFTDWRALELEQKVMEIHLAQVRHGVYIDLEGVKKTIALFDKNISKLERTIVDYAPKKIHGGKYKSIEEPFLKGTTTHKKAVEQWFPEDHLREKVQGGFSRLIIEDFNPSSDPQVKELLLSLGWKPTEWNWKEVGGKQVRMSPKLTEDSFVSLPKGLGKSIAKYKKLNHRRNFLCNMRDPDGKGLLSNIDPNTGRVRAEAITCGTPTSRYKHKGSVCNVPDNGSLGGKLLRGAFAVPEAHWMLGLDLDGIEARMLAHYCADYKGGDELTHVIVGQGDFHTENAKAWGIDRRTAKPVLYALLYGAGGPKLASIAGYPVSQGAHMKQVFYDRWPCIAQLIKDLEHSYKVLGNHIVGLAGRKIHIRGARMLMNSLFQQSAAEVFKYWMVRCDLRIQSNKWPLHQIIAYHDELVYEWSSDDNGALGIVKSTLCDEAYNVGKYLGVKVPIEASGGTGKSWKDVH